MRESKRTQPPRGLLGGLLGLSGAVLAGCVAARSVPGPAMTRPAAPAVVTQAPAIPPPDISPAPAQIAAVPSLATPPPPPAAAVTLTDAAVEAGVHAGDAIFGLTRLHRIDVSLSAAEWGVMQQSSARGGGTERGADYTDATGRIIHVGGGFLGYFPWVHADFRLDGVEFKNIGLRYRGNGSFSASSAMAPLRANMKVKLDLYGTKGTWDGEKTLNFNAGSVDTSLMRESIAFAIFRAAGVAGPRTAYAEMRFTVPGIYDRTPALYTLIEQVNKPFLRRALPPGTGLLMKPEGLRGGITSFGSSWSSYITPYRPDREATPQEQRRVIEFAQLVNQPDVALFRSRIGDYLDVDGFLRYLAVNAFLENWDSYLSGSHNFYLYLDPKDDKFRFIPWDQDLGLGARGGMGTNILAPQRGDNALIYWLLDDPKVMAQYRAILKELSATVLSTPELMKLVDAVEGVVGNRAGTPRFYLQNRAAYLQQLTAGW